MTEVSCLLSRGPSQGRARSLLVPSIVSTRKRVQVFTVEYIYSHTNRLDKELTVDFGNLKSTLISHTVMYVVQYLGQYVRRTHSLPDARIVASMCSEMIFLSLRTYNRVSV